MYYLVNDESYSLLPVSPIMPASWGLPGVWLSSASDITKDNFVSMLLVQAASLSFQFKIFLSRNKIV